MKRAFDLLVILVGSPLIIPLLLALCLCQWIALGRPLFFRQARAGQDGRHFQIIKFRTMREGDGSDAARLTPWGKRMRASSLDEIPELWNVLRGEMSLVGPRPLPVTYLPRYNANQARRHATRPGITGWAQINGRNRLSWEQQFELDLWYVDNRSLWLDLRILLQTVLPVLRRADISEQGQATRTEFTGSQSSDGKVS